MVRCLQKYRLYLIQRCPILWRHEASLEQTNLMIAQFNKHPVTLHIKYQFVNFSDVIWRHRTWSTLVQVMACCLTAPNNLLNQRWLIISVFWRSTAAISQDILKISGIDCSLKITAVPRRVKFKVWRCFTFVINIVLQCRVSIEVKISTPRLLVCSTVQMTSRISRHRPWNSLFYYPIASR